MCAIVRKSDILKATSGILALFLLFIVGSALFFIFHRIIYGLQRLLHQRAGETLIGSSNIVIGILALVIGLDFFIVDFLYKLSGKYYPGFYRNYYFDSDSELKINEKAFRKFKIVLVSVFVFGICVTYFFFNEYISLGDRYIAASSMSFIHNRQEYNYSDIEIWERRPRNSNESWVHKYKFPDGKELSNIGAFAGNTIKAIQAKQRNLGIRISDAYQQPSSQKQRSRSYIAYLIWISTFFFIPWTLRNLFKRKS